MKNIFEGAKEGDKFITRDRSISIYNKSYEYNGQIWHSLTCIGRGDEDGEYIYSVLSNGTLTENGRIECSIDIIRKRN